MPRFNPLTREIDSCSGAIATGKLLKWIVRSDSDYGAVRHSAMPIAMTATLL